MVFLLDASAVSAMMREPRVLDAKGQSHSSRPLPEGMRFHVLRASNEPDEFLVTDEAGAAHPPECMRRGIWIADSGHLDQGFRELDR